MLPRSMMTVRDLAEYLGVSRQPVEAIWRSAHHGFPSPVGKTPTGRVWDRVEVEAWARARWWGTRTWSTP